MFHIRIDLYGQVLSSIGANKMAAAIVSRRPCNSDPGERGNPVRQPIRFRREQEAARLEKNHRAKKTVVYSCNAPFGPFLRYLASLFRPQRPSWMDIESKMASAPRRPLRSRPMRLNLPSCSLDAVNLRLNTASLLASRTAT